MLFEKLCNGSRSEIYLTEFNNEQVIAKFAFPEFQNYWDQELNFYKTMSHPNIVTFKGMGVDKKFQKYFLIEELNPILEQLSLEEIQNIADSLVDVQRYLYKKNIWWVCRKEHIGYDKNGILKIFDFNDCQRSEYTNLEEPCFIGDKGIIDWNCDNIKEYGYWWSGLVPLLCRLLKDSGFSKQNVRPILQKSIDKLIVKEYQSLKNVHQPIPIERLKDTMRPETEENASDYGQMKMANRKCTDRLEMIVKNRNKGWWKGKKILDLGCSTGWFCFKLDDLGAKTYGIDIDKEKIEFAKLIAELEGKDIKYWAENFSLDSNLCTL